MNDQAQKFARSYDLSAKATAVLQKRRQFAQERFAKRVQEAYKNNIEMPKGTPISPWHLWQEGYDYAVDLAQRTILFWDTLRQRGNNFIAHERAGNQPT